MADEILDAAAGFLAGTREGAAALGSGRRIGTAGRPGKIAAGWWPAGTRCSPARLARPRRSSYTPGQPTGTWRGHRNGAPLKNPQSGQPSRPIAPTTPRP
jgi:hypothetical protein